MTLSTIDTFEELIKILEMDKMTPFPPLIAMKITKRCREELLNFTKLIVSNVNTPQICNYLSILQSCHILDLYYKDIAKLIVTVMIDKKISLSTLSSLQSFPPLCHVDHLIQDQLLRRKCKEAIKFHHAYIMALNMADLVYDLITNEREEISSELIIETGTGMTYSQFLFYFKNESFWTELTSIISKRIIEKLDQNYHRLDINDILLCFGYNYKQIRHFDYMILWAIFEWLKEKIKKRKKLDLIIKLFALFAFDGESSPYLDEFKESEITFYNAEVDIYKSIIDNEDENKDEMGNDCKDETECKNESRNENDYEMGNVMKKMEFQDISIPRFIRKESIFAILINFFDSKEIFLARWKCYFVRMLLTQESSFNQLKFNQEILKSKILEIDWKDMEIIIRDYGNIHKNQALIYSFHYWPKVEFDLKLPELIREKWEREIKTRITLKDRQLKWMNAMGMVKLTLKYSNSACRIITCPPLEATILLNLCGDDNTDSNHSLDFDSLITKTQITNKNCLRDGLDWLCKRGIVVSSFDGFYKLNDHLTEEEEEVGSEDENKREYKRKSHQESIEEVSERENERKNENYIMNAFPFIKNILNTLGPISSDRLESMLKIHIITHYEHLKEQGGSLFLLSELVKRELIMFKDGKYSLSDKQID